MRGFPAIECRRIRLRRLSWFSARTQCERRGPETFKEPTQPHRPRPGHPIQKEWLFFFFASDNLGMAEECHQRNSPNNIPEERGQEEVREVAAI
jgi:hypothetical protein